MGLFGNKEDKENKKLEKLNKQMQQYGLENLSTADKEQVRLILLGLMGTGFIEFGTNLSGKSEDVAKMSFLRAIVEQNWMIISKLDEISKKLK